MLAGDRPTANMKRSSAECGAFLLVAAGGGRLASGWRTIGGRLGRPSWFRPICTNFMASKPLFISLVGTTGYICTSLVQLLPISEAKSQFCWDINLFFPVIVPTSFHFFEYPLQKSVHSLLYFLSCPNRQLSTPPLRHKIGHFYHQILANVPTDLPKASQAQFQ